VITGYKKGQNTSVEKYVVIEDGCMIGNNVVIEDFAAIKSETTDRQYKAYTMC
jgi:UDP-3-O-[3-hydroxymyristoyl] glucosamine N-acyltransferase